MAQQPSEISRHLGGVGRTPIVTLLGERTYIEQDSILLDRRIAHEIGDGKILARIRDEGFPYKNIDLVYSGGDGEHLFHSEEGFYGHHLDWVETVRYVKPGVLLVRTRYQSTGATGDTELRREARVFVFDKTGLSQAGEFILFENWRPAEFRTLDADSVGPDVFLTLRSLRGIELYKVDRERRSIVQQDPGVTRLSPSFDCEQASSWAEKLLCFSPALAALDAIQAELFQGVRSDPTFVASQREWLKTRDRCRTARSSELRSCLARHYEQRIRELLRARQNS